MENKTKNTLPTLPAFGLHTPLYTPAGLLVLPETVEMAGARLRLVPRPAAMDTALNAACGGRWKTSRYMIGRTPYCKLSIWDADAQQWIERDAPDGGQYCAAFAEAAKAEEAGSLYNAMLHFGFYADLAAMPLMVFRADQIHIEAVAQGQRVTGYRLAGGLTVADVQREGSSITRVVLRDKNGGEVVWAR